MSQVWDITMEMRGSWGWRILSAEEKKRLCPAHLLRPQPNKNTATLWDIQELVKNGDVAHHTVKWWGVLRGGKPFPFVSSQQMHLLSGSISAWLSVSQKWGVRLAEANTARNMRCSPCLQSSFQCNKTTIFLFPQFVSLLKTSLDFKRLFILN